MRWELIASPEHLFQILDAKNAPTGHFRIRTMPRNVHRAIDVLVDTMRLLSLVQAIQTRIVLASPASITVHTYRSV